MLLIVKLPPTVSPWLVVVKPEIITSSKCVCPFTSNFAVGIALPIPTLPPAIILTCSSILPLLGPALTPSANLLLFCVFKWTTLVELFLIEKEALLCLCKAKM